MTGYSPTQRGGTRRVVKSLTTPTQSTGSDRDRSESRQLSCRCQLTPMLCSSPQGPLQRGIALPGCYVFLAPPP